MVGNKRTPGHQMVRRLTPKLTPRHSSQTLSSKNNVRAGAKGCLPFKKVQFFLTLFKRPSTPPPFYLNICPILQGVFFWTLFKRPLPPPPPFIWKFVLFCRGCFLNAFLSIWYNVPISPPNVTINASKVPFHRNFMLLNVKNPSASWQAIGPPQKSSKCPFVFGEGGAGSENLI